MRSWVIIMGSEEPREWTTADLYSVLQKGLREGWLWVNVQVEGEDWAWQANRLEYSQERIYVQYVEPRYPKPQE